MRTFARNFGIFRLFFGVYAILGHSDETLSHFKNDIK